MSYNHDERILKLINPVRNPAKSGNYRIKSIERFVRELEDEAVLNLNPNFQRGQAWTEEQQTKFMESILCGYTNHETNIIRLNDSTLAKMNNMY